VKLSAFNIYVPDYPEPDSTLVYNTFSGGFVALDAATLAVLNKADAGGELDAAEQELVDPEFFDESVGILIESRSVEERAFRDRHSAWRTSTERLDCIVSTSLACNLDCTYCCQADVLNGKTMSPQTAAATGEWLATRALEIGAKAVNLSFMGGEPLLHPHRIRQIVEAVRARTAGAGVVVRFSLITNGVFMTKALVKEWLPLGLVAAQVTLDGDETTHSLTRRSKKKGEDSFATIFKNVVDTSELIDIFMNGNYTTETVHGFVPLLEKLVAAGFKKGSRVHFSPALQALGAPPEAGLGGCNYGSTHPEWLIPLADAVRRAGYEPLDDSAPGPCAFHRRHSYSIDSDGHIYVCPGFVGRPDWSAGHVTNGLNARYERISNFNPQRACGSCAQRPDCSGGCVAAEWLKSGRMEGVDCDIQYFDKYKPEFIKRKFLLASSDSVEEALSRFPDTPDDLKHQLGDVVRKHGGGQVSLRVLAA
jgi:uncharacterized protein